MIHFDCRKKEYIMSTLLLIDDDDEVLSINCKYLSGEGYSVYTASNPTDALKLICQISPDCIILDIMMPQADGYQVCKKIRTFSDVPIIFLTGKSSEDDTVCVSCAPESMFCSADLQRHSRFRTIIWFKFKIWLSIKSRTKQYFRVKISDLPIANMKYYSISQNTQIRKWLSKN